MAYSSQIKKDLGFPKHIFGIENTVDENIIATEKSEIFFFTL